MFSKKDIIIIISSFNKQYGTNIKTNNQTKPQLLRQLKNHLSCRLDSCILKRSKKINDVLKPLGPGSDQWLSNFDITSVMQEYEKLYDNFLFMGAVPIDFQEIDTTFSNFNLKQFMKTKDIMGVIFNTDPSYKSGQHWIALVMNIPKQTICFFDSAGTGPPQQVKTFINKLIEQGKRNKIQFNVFINKKQHQKGDTACGIYSIHFIVKQLHGYSCQQINNSVIRDKDMKKNLKVYFSY